MGEEVRDRTDALDAAGNTTAAIGKGFAIGSACLVSLALFGGFLHNSGLDGAGQAEISLTKPEIFAGLLIGAMLPYVFSGFTIKSVGKAAFGMVEEVRRQIREDPGILAGTSEPDYKACIRISTRSSLKEMIAPGCLVFLHLFRSSSHLFS
jgi:Na+/H+-translocating membrane pyrophosphatase